MPDYINPPDYIQPPDAQGYIAPPDAVDSGFRKLAGASFPTKPAVTPDTGKPTEQIGRAHV